VSIESPPQDSVTEHYLVDGRIIEEGTRLRTFVILY